MKKCRDCRKEFAIKSFYPTSKYKGKQYYSNVCRKCNTKAIDIKSRKKRDEALIQQGREEVIKKDKTDFYEVPAPYNKSKKLIDAYSAGYSEGKS